MLSRADEALRTTRTRADELESEVWSGLGGDVSDL
jgi:hypothetical protein